MFRRYLLSLQLIPFLFFPYLYVGAGKGKGAAQQSIYYFMTLIILTVGHIYLQQPFGATHAFGHLDTHACYLFWGYYAMTTRHVGQHLFINCLLESTLLYILSGLFSRTYMQVQVKVRELLCSWFTTYDVGYYSCWTYLFTVAVWCYSCFGHLDTYACYLLWGYYAMTTRHVGQHLFINCLLESTLLYILSRLFPVARGWCRRSKAYEEQQIHFSNLIRVF